MKILSIGNSFSQDAQRYLHNLAKARGTNLKTVNLYIGGCSLRNHYLNMLENSSSYALEFNGESTGMTVSLSQVLCSDDWDVITLQQVSHESFKPDSYYPYIEAIADYAKKYCPHAKLMLHETWGYANGSDRLNGLGFSSMEDMSEKIFPAYRQAAEKIGADGIIPSGEAFMAALKAGAPRLHRDGFHASLGLGRYILALTWYKHLTGLPIEGDSFDGLDEKISSEERALAIQAVNSVIM